MTVTYNPDDKRVEIAVALNDRAPDNPNHPKHLAAKKRKMEEADVSKREAKPKCKPVDDIPWSETDTFKLITQPGIIADQEATISNLRKTVGWLSIMAAVLFITVLFQWGLRAL